MRTKGIAPIVVRNDGGDFYFRRWPVHVQRFLNSELREMECAERLRFRSPTFAVESAADAVGRMVRMQCMVYCKDAASTGAVRQPDLLGLQFSGRGKWAPAFAVSGGVRR